VGDSSSALDYCASEEVPGLSAPVSSHSAELARNSQQDFGPDLDLRHLMRGKIQPGGGSWIGREPLGRDALSRELRHRARVRLDLLGGLVVELVLRRGPFATAVPRVSAGGLKPEITARVWETRPSCCRA